MKPHERLLRGLERFSTAMLSALGYLPAAGLLLAAGRWSPPWSRRRRRWPGWVSWPMTA